ncbi:MAG: FHA domain-containing protein [Gammaproteobacteria bacterium]|nr:FHA domain-containing protein [Gammaproteobacteria bacterium]
MSKLIIKYNEAVIDHIELRQGDMKIGRRSGCEIVLDHLAISGEHANIFTIGGDSFIQDLNSTNGTFINNKRVAKHHLRNGDTISIGQHSLVYLNEPAFQDTHEGDTLAKTVVINPSAPVAPTPARASTATPTPAPAPDRPLPEVKPAAPTIERRGTLFVLDGANSGKRIELTKAVTNLGKTGKQAGVITRTSDGYMLEASKEGDIPKVNGRAISSSGNKLRNGDIIEVAGIRVQFYLK